LKRPRIVATFAVAFAALSLGWATGLVSLPWTHDLDRQPSIKPQEMPMLAPEGTVPIGGRVDDGQRENANALVNSVPADSSALRRGKNAYVTYCQPCHGATGIGDGAVAKSLPIPPVDLTRPDLMDARSDGSLYYTIRHGNVIMPGYAYALTPELSWEVVHYVRTLRTQ
jgi:mono/diheme cytochrome c family protein